MSKVVTTYARPALALPRGPSRAGVELSLYPITAALVLFKIARDVRIKWVGGYTAGHRGDERGHLITLSTNVDAEVANGNLWHELGHAWQAERFPDDDAFHQAYLLASGPWGGGAVAYRNNPYEIEPNRIKDTYGRFLLASGGGPTRLQPGFEWESNPEHGATL
jgi:hypothetical protein